MKARTGQRRLSAKCTDSIVEIEGQDGLKNPVIEYSTKPGQPLQEKETNPPGGRTRTPMITQILRPEARSSNTKAFRTR